MHARLKTEEGSVAVRTSCKPSPIRPMKITMPCGVGGGPFDPAGFDINSANRAVREWLAGDRWARPGLGIHLGTLASARCRRQRFDGNQRVPIVVVVLDLAFDTR